MKAAFYFQLKKYIKSTKVALLLTEIIYGIFLIIFQVRKFFLRKKCHRNFTEKEAVELLNEKLPFTEPKYQCLDRMEDSQIMCSVIIPVYNHEDILEKNLDSVVDQMCSYNYEIILVDDGSNEETKKILKKYEPIERCRVIYQENQGIGCARNTGLDYAVGKYIMFVDCDDMVKNNILQTLLDAALKNDSDIVLGGYQLVKEHKGEITSVKDYIYPKELMQTFTDENNIMSLPGLPWGKIYKRTLFENVRFLPGYWYEDSIIQFIVYRKCKTFSYVPEVLYEYKWHESNFSKVQGSKANIKSIQRYWLLLLMIKMSNENRLPEDATFYITLLRHLGSYYYHHVKEFDEELGFAMFIAGAELLKKYKPKQPYKLTFILRQIEKGLLERNYELWKLACQYQ